MYRNLYIEAYKSSLTHNSTLELMLCHLNHIYTTLGCVIQDIEFMVAQVIASKPQKERMSMPNQINQRALNVPKVQLLPSSSIRIDCPVLAENTRHGKLIQEGRIEEERRGREKEGRKEGKERRKQGNEKSIWDSEENSMMESQDDFIDLLFRKKR